MSLIDDIVFCLKPRCPACCKGRLFQPYSLSVVDQCDVCQAPLSRNDVGDGAAVFLIFLLGLLIVPMAWVLELWMEPPLWVHAVLWGVITLGLIALLMPALKCYVILLEHRHRPGGVRKD